MSSGEEPIARRGPLSRLAVWVALVPVRLYQLGISPLLGPRCRYHPTCSAYAVDALRGFGILKGTVLAAWRLLRCNPWSRGGIDRVEDQRLFRAPPSTTPPSATQP